MLVRFVFLLITFFTSAAAVAQASVRDSAEAQQSTAFQQPASNFAYDIQIMQEEIQSLRGLVEQQAFEIKRLKQQRLDDYLDLDKRVSELTRQQSQTVAPSPSGNVGSSSSVTDGIRLTGSDADAKALYDEAIDLLLNKQDYSGANEKFNQYITRYPKGSFTPNVYYWQGQIALADSKKDDATTLFQQLINDYPEHAKVADAKFKLARLYFESDKKQEAKTLLEEVAASDTDAALLAKSFLSKNYPK